LGKLHICQRQQSICSAKNIRSIENPLIRQRLRAICTDTECCCAAHSNRLIDRLCDDDWRHRTFPFTTCIVDGCDFVGSKGPLVDRHLVYYPVEMPVCQTLCQNFGVLTDADRKTIGGNRTRRRRADVQRPVNVNILRASIIHRRHMMPLAIHYVAIALQICLTQILSAETNIVTGSITVHSPGRIALGHYRRPTSIPRLQHVQLDPCFDRNRIGQDIERRRIRNRNVITPIEQKSLPNFPIRVKKRPNTTPIVGPNTVIGIIFSLPPVYHARRSRITRWHYKHRQHRVGT